MKIRTNDGSEIYRYLFRYKNINAFSTTYSCIGDMYLLFIQSRSITSLHSFALSVQRHIIITIHAQDNPDSVDTQIDVGYISIRHASVGYTRLRSECLCYLGRSELDINRWVSKPLIHAKFQKAR